MVSDWIRSNPVKSGVVALLGLLLGYASFQVAGSLRAFDDIASEEFSPAAAGSALRERSRAEVDRGVEDLIAAHRDQLLAAYQAQLSQEAAEAEAMAALEELRRSGRDASFSIAAATSPRLPDEMFTSTLLIGADASGFLADVIIDVLLPADGSRPIMVSIPRDLYLPNRCTEGYTRVNANLGGCRGVASGPELLALAVGDFTGVEVDHFARVDFDGFVQVIDRLGGTQVCVGELPVRDLRSGLHLGPGCHHADGATTLAWVRSRNPQYLVEGEWTTRGGSDFDRQRKQQDVLFQLADRLSSHSSAASLAGVLQSLSGVVRMDSGWAVSEAASLAFRYRGISREDVVRLSIPVENRRTSSGALVLVPTTRFNDLLADVHPAASA